MKNRFNVSDEKAMLCRFHVQTGGSTLTAQQVENNIARTTIQALSAVLGGAQSLHTNSFDEALALPTINSAKIALRTQQIIAHETGVTNYVDPLANSEQVEELTKKMIDDVRYILEEVDNKGGAIDAIKDGWIQDEISNSSYKFQQSIDAKEKIVVGLNKYIEDEEIDINLQKIEENALKKQLAEIKKLKNNRDNAEVKNKINSLELCTQTNENLMPKIIDAARAECTLGEISDAMRRSFGEYK